MLSPSELKNKEFSKSLRGYCSEEVDEHIDFIIKKYSELCRENDELEKKLRLTEAQLEAMKSEEDSIRSALINAQKAGNKIIKEANEKAAAIMHSAKENCDKLISQTKANIDEENNKLITAKNKVSEFKAYILSEYASHMKKLDNIIPDETAKSSDEEENIDELVYLLKKNIEQQFEIKPQAEIKADKEAASSDDVTKSPPQNDIEEKSTSSYESQEQKQEYDPLHEQTIIFERSDIDNGSIINSIKNLNKSVTNNFDDDDFFAMLQKTANSNSNSSNS